MGAFSRTGRRRRPSQVGSTAGGAVAAPAVDVSTGTLRKLPSAPPPAKRHAATDGRGGGGGDGDGDGRGRGGGGDIGAVVSPERQRLAKLESNAESASGAPAGGGTSQDRGRTLGAPRRPAEGDCRAPPPLRSVPVRHRFAAPCRDSGRQRPPLPWPRRPRPPTLPPAPAAPTEATVTTNTAATATATS